MCQFQIEFKGQVEDLLKRAQDGIQAQGGTFEIVNGSYYFSFQDPVVVKGYFTLGENVANISIEKKPFYVPCSMIEKKLKDLDL